MKNFVLLCFTAVLLVAGPASAADKLPTFPFDEIRLVQGEDGETHIVGSDNMPSPKGKAKAELRRKAVQQRIAARQQSGKTHQVAAGQYVDFPVQQTDRIFVMLVEFGSKGGWITSPSNPGMSQVAGPLHNQIPQPNRSVDNYTIWQPDYNREHYVDMYFNKMKEYYRSQSSGRYTFEGEVMHWVKVPFNGPRYGANAVGLAGGTWSLIADTINTWVAGELASGKTIQEVTNYLKTYDVADRYDYNHNGNFNEPDGYIDHFQIVHAGAGEETDTVKWADNIWSHRSFAFSVLDGTYASIGYPAVGPAYNKNGGIEFGGGWGANPTGTTLGSTSYHVTGVTVGVPVATSPNVYTATPTGIWVGDYTIQPENGGLGVFAHEYGHDLGLPDHYDTAGGNNGTGYWTIMSSGSYLGEGGEDVGARPGDMSAWDKLQLGWLSYDLATFGKTSAHKIGPAETTTKAAQAVVIPLPEEQNFIYEYDTLAANTANGKVWYSGSANSYEATMTRSIDVPATAADAKLTMRLAYNIETNWDYAYVSVSNNGGSSWTNLAAAGVTTTTNANGQNAGNGITGTSSGAWKNASFNLAPYAGQTVLLRVRYWTDQFTFNWGIVVDDIKVGAFADDAENSPNGWTIANFKQSSGKVITSNPHFYIAEFRQYRGYDTGLQTGPYAGTGYLNGKVGHYPYQDGLLITYADYDWSNNNTSTHPGQGFALPIDARPTPRTRLGVQEPGSDRFWNISAWTPAVQVFDATFGLEPTDALTMPFLVNLPPLPGSPAGSPNRLTQFSIDFPSQTAVPFFNDLNQYWFSTLPSSSALIPQTGTTLRVISTSAQDNFMHVIVNGGF